MMELLLAVLGRGETPPLASLEARDWEALFEASCEHGVTPLLRHRLHERGAADHVPPPLARRLRDLHVLNALRAEARRLQVAEALCVLESREVPVVLLKGAFLAEHAYASPALRPMCDVDLLVAGADLGTALEGLVAIGYSSPGEACRAAYGRHRHAPPLHRPGHLPVELHTTIEPCAPPFRLPLADAWARARPAPLAAGPALALAPEDLLLHLAIHMGRSHLLGASLVSVCDVDAWMERHGATADWDAVVRRATACDARRFVHAALGLAERALGTRVDPAVRRALRGDSGASDDAVIAEAMAVLLWPRRFPGDPSSLLHLRASWSGVRRVVRALVVHPARRWRRAPSGGGPTPAADGASTRWAAAARFLLDPANRRAIREQRARIEELRRWALEPA